MISVYNHNRLNITRLFEFLIALCLMLESESIFMWIVPNSSMYKNLVYFVLISLLILLILCAGLKFKRKEFTLLCISSLYYLIFLVLNLSQLKTGFMFASVCMAFLIYEMSTLKKGKEFVILRHFTNIMAVLALISLFFWLSGSVFHIISTDQTINITRNDIVTAIPNYHFFYFETQIDNSFSLNIARNTGIFYEAPKYSLNLCIALLYELLFNKKKFTWKVYVLALTILSTLSTTGIILVLIIWVTKYLSVMPKSKLNLLIRNGVITCLALCVFVAIRQLLFIKSGTNSYTDRYDDFIAGYKAWIANPVLGSGFKDMTVIHSYMSSFRAANIGFSNSVFRVLAQGGIFLFLMYLLPFAKAFYESIKNKNKEMFIFISAMVYLFVFTSFPYNYITAYLVAIFLLHKNPERESIPQTIIAEKIKEKAFCTQFEQV